MTAKVSISFPVSPWMVPIAVLLTVMLFTGCSSNKESSSVEATRMNAELAEENEQGSSRSLTWKPTPPIGLLPGLEYEGEAIEYFKDRLLLLYTDGLNEAENRQQEQFGEDRIIEILTSRSSSNAQGIIEALETGVARFRDGAEPNDDLTILCLSLL